MARFFPPSLSPNNKATISDARYQSIHGVSRFVGYECDCVVYWPWLSWADIDVSLGPDNQALPRATLIAPTAPPMYGVTPDGIGTIVRFGDATNAQKWEVLHYFDWFLPGDTEKKFSLCWFRLWTGAAPPVAPVPISGGVSWPTAVFMSVNTLYQATLGDVQQFFSAPTIGGQFAFMYDNAPGNPVTGEFLAHSIDTSPTIFDSHVDSGSGVLIPPATNVGLNLAPTPGGGPFPFNFMLTYPFP